MVTTVIKPGQSFKVAQRLTTIDLADHLAEAEKILEDARAQARAILAQGRRDAAAGLQAARLEGHREGLQQGRAEGLAEGREQALQEARQRFDAELESLRSALAAAVQEFEASKRDLLIAARQDALDFAIALARRIAKRVGECDRDAAAANLEACLRAVGSATDVVVRAHPLDAANLRRFAHEWVQRLAACVHVSIEEDPAVTPGGCVMAAGATRIDATLETQMEEIARLLVGAELRGPAR